MMNKIVDTFFSERTFPEVGKVQVKNLTMRHFITTPEELEKYRTDVERGMLLASRITLIDGKKVDIDYLLDCYYMDVIEFIFDCINAMNMKMTGVLNQINNKQNG